MRPTPQEVLANPDLFVQLLTLQGVENAQAKVSAVAYEMLEYGQVESYYKRLGKEITQNEQDSSFYPMPKDKKIFKREALRRHKKISQTRRLHLRYGQYLSRKLRMIKAKIDKWPELTWDPKSLKVQPDKALMKKYIMRKTSLRPPKTG